MKNNSELDPDKRAQEGPAAAIAIKTVAKTKIVKA
jgi:hypothetical protein